MEVEENQTQSCKYPRLENGSRPDSNKIGVSRGNHDHYPVDEEDGEPKRPSIGLTDGNNGTNRLRGWHHPSRIIRVSRNSGGKDRHSKVWTSKGLRDRRVRLSVTTAIQFYDLQDRLGYDQPSKAVEWLIKAASDSIAELPSLNNSFTDTPKQLSDENRASIEQGFDSAEVELDGDANFQPHQQTQQLSLSRSACSSTSETSKGSGLSLSRSEIRENRVKARERARDRAAKEKEKDNEPHNISHHLHHHHQNLNPISQNSSFTELLTGGIGNVSNNATSPSRASAQQNHGGELSFFNKATAVTPLDYFDSGLLGLSTSSRTHHSSGFTGQIQTHLGNSIPMSIPTYSSVNSGGNHVDLQHISFVPEHLMPIATSQPNNNGGDFNLSFSISSGLAGFNRGTLQSNSPSLLPHHHLLQRFPPIEGSNVPIFIGAASAAPPLENHHHHQFPAGFDGRLQLCYADGSRQSDQKEKGKN